MIIVSVKLRLQRIGSKKEPRYRIVVTNSEVGSSAGYIEKVGNYFPTAENEEDGYEVDSEKALKWLQNGAKPSSTVKDILSSAGVLEALQQERDSEV